MLSVIICSRNKTITDDFYNNINSTIGCEYELIIIDNSENHYSIFEAFNLGIIKSEGLLLCFLHDDIYIHTKGWGNILINIFKSDKNIGLFGVAGTKIKTKTPSAWWDCPEDQKLINLIQHIPNREKEKWNIGFNLSPLEDVVAIDGVFMAMRKDKRIYFNPKSSGFHNYDLNISFEYKKYGYRIIVTNQILIEHFSLGNINSDWVKSTYNIHNLYKNILPLSLEHYKVSRTLEVTNSKKFILKCLKYNNIKLAFSGCIKLLWLNPLSLFNFKFQIKFFHYLLLTLPGIMRTNEVSGTMRATEYVK